MEQYDTCRERTDPHSRSARSVAKERSVLMSKEPH